MAPPPVLGVAPPSNEFLVTSLYIRFTYSYSYSSLYFYKKIDNCMNKRNEIKMSEDLNKYCTGMAKRDLIL